MLGRKIEGKKMRVEISEPTGSAIGGGAHWSFRGWSVSSIFLPSIFLPQCFSMKRQLSPSDV
jgi:hypothetical protein